MNETVYEHLAGSTTFTVTASERWSINMIRKLKDKRPDEVEIVAENPDGSIVAHVPVEWMKIRPKREVNLTDEQRKAMVERMKTLSNSRGK